MQEACVAIGAHFPRSAPSLSIEFEWRRERVADGHGDGPSRRL